MSESAGRRTRCLLLVIAVLLLAACGAAPASLPAGTPSDAATHVPRTLTLLTLGDSVPAGTACGCAPFGKLVSERIAAVTGDTVRYEGRAVPGITSAQLERMVSGDRATQAAIRRADVIVIMIGANDVADPVLARGACAVPLDCYAQTIDGVRGHVESVLDRVAALHGMPAPLVVLVQYWNVWKDGSTAAKQGADYVQVSRQVTAAVNSALAGAAASRSTHVVSLASAFGTDQGDDDTGLLEDDGDHPNARGHRAIAAAVVSQVPGLLGL